MKNSNRVPYLSYNCRRFPGSNQQMDQVCVLNLNRRPCNLQGRTVGLREALIKADCAKCQEAGRSVRQKMPDGKTLSQIRSIRGNNTNSEETSEETKAKKSEIKKK